MCIAYLAISAHTDWPLLIAANRDEFHARPATPAGPWSDHPDVLAGIDELAGGTWLGLTRQGRFGLLTNYRDMQQDPQAISRGELVADYLKNGHPPAWYAHQISGRGGQYNGFNLIVGDLQQAFYVSNRHNDHNASALTSGTYVLSNHLLNNTAWPKAHRLKQRLDDFLLSQLEMTPEPIFEILKDQTIAPDHALPRTGLPLTQERLLSSPFIISPDYGTRCSTVIAIHRQGHGIFSEVTYNPAGEISVRRDWPLTLPD